MSELAALLHQHIARDGPIGVDEFMAQALGHPEYGYYMNRDPFGRAGDFITAPETSQMFGELLGLWFADTWQRAGSPPKARLVELGPGRGSLMVDALRALSGLPGARDAMAIHLVETSPYLRDMQRAALADPTIAWHDRLQDVEGSEPTFIIANEFFDALPVRQFVATTEGWRERLVASDGTTFHPVLADQPASQDLLPMEPAGRVSEISSARQTVMATVAERLVRNGGAALIIDFAGAGDTFQAVRGHQQVDRFDCPGFADLAAAVDFSALSSAATAAGARCFGPVDQGDFLDRQGIGTRAAALAQNANDAQRASIETGLARLTDDDAMGRLYKVLAVCHPDLSAPAGFGEAA